jgi:hypothetical protein
MNRRHPVIIVAVIVATASWLLASPSVTPIEFRGVLTRGDDAFTFSLAAPEWLFLESDLVLRASGDERPVVVATVNDVELRRFRPASLYVAERSRTLIPIGHLRAGPNTLRLDLADGSAADFVMNLRLQNYHGINPRFPRALIIADEAAADHRAARGLAWRLVDWLVWLAIMGAAFWTAARVIARFTSFHPLAILAAPAVTMWAGVAYGVVTPFQLWLSSEAIAVLTGGPALVAAAVGWLIRSRRRLWRPAFAAALMIGLGEASLRVVHWIAPSPVFYTDSYSRFRGRPGAPFHDTHLNSRGFNDVERTAAKPAGVDRIVAIGDSMVFGVVPRRQHFLTLLEADLNRNRRVEILNMGVPGTEPKDYLAILVEEGLSFSPDLVLVGFFIGNDFEVRARRVHEHSYVATLFYFLWRVASGIAPAAAGVESSGTSYDDDAPTFDRARFFEIQVTRAEIYYDDSRVLDAARRAAGYLREMRDLARGAGADLVVAIMPDETQINDMLRDEVERALAPAAREQFDIMRPNRAITHELSRHGIAHYDLTAAFREHRPAGRLYKPQDTHWNIAGNRLAAALLAGHIRDGGY